LQEQLVQLANVKLWTISEGKGPPLMLCNGGPGYCDYLAPVAEMISDLIKKFLFRNCYHQPVAPSFRALLMSPTLLESL
jgi:hypothetical protein